MAGEDTRAKGALTPLWREDTRAAWGTCRRMLVRYCLERFVSHRSVSRVSDAEIASEILLVVSHL
eukprot:COSAG02_NODE_32348_length_517_cov_9.686603_1_plen_64_part_10